LEELPDYQKIKLQFMEYLQDDTPTNDEDRKFEELCNNYMISTTEPTEYGEYESVSVFGNRKLQLLAIKNTIASTNLDHFINEFVMR
jgi:hypothetical protein